MRVVHDHVGFDSELARGVPRSDKAVELALFHRDRLFAEDVLASFERLYRPIDMQMVGQRNIDGLDIGIGQQRVVVGVDLEVRREGLKRLGLLGIRRRDGRKLGTLGGVDRASHEFLGEIRRPQNTPFNRLHDFLPDYVERTLDRGAREVKADKEKARTWRALSVMQFPACLFPWQVPASVSGFSRTHELRSGGYARG